MSRFIGLVLMMTTGALVPEFLVAGGFELQSFALLLSGALFGLGLLFGALATGRALVWAGVTAAAVVGIQFVAGRLAFAGGRGEVGESWVLLLTPPLALLAGGVLGAHVVRSRAQRQIKPESSE